MGVSSPTLGAVYSRRRLRKTRPPQECVIQLGYNTVAEESKYTGVVKGFLVLWCEVLCSVVRFSGDILRDPTILLATALLTGLVRMVQVLSSSLQASSAFVLVEEMRIGVSHKEAV